MLLPIELDAATVVIVVRCLLVALTIPYDGNRFIRRSPYDGIRYGTVLEGNIDTGLSSAVAIAAVVAVVLLAVVVVLVVVASLIVSLVGFSKVGGIKCTGWAQYNTDH